MIAQQRRFEKSELSIGIPIETMKKIKSLGANVCVIRTVNKNGYNILNIKNLKEVQIWDTERTKKKDLFRVNTK